MISPAPAKTLHDLEYPRMLAALVERCVSPQGAAAAAAHRFAEGREAARQWIAEGQEAIDLLFAGEPLPVGPLRETGEALARLRASGVLAGPEIRALLELVRLGRTLRKFVSQRIGRLPALSAILLTDPTLDRIEESLGTSFDGDGALADHASPHLRELRSEFRNARGRMLARMEELLVRHASIIQEHFVTEREGRWVLPIRSDAHERFPGIVHASSASGATLFVEPRSVIPMGNRLKVLEGEIAREELAIYTQMSSDLAERLPSLLGLEAAIARADVLAAIARLAEELGLQYPVLADDARLDLKKARHPILLLDGVDVVPSDLSVAAGHAVVVSGPNAGGKTVALKTLGLAALFIRAGLPIPAGAGSSVGYFEQVLTDVGDEQSLQKNLSTFSAHVQNVAGILEATREGVLVLLDELAGGTDPREGEALAAGILQSLCARRGAVVVTTHYEGLKALALADDRFTNASVGFNRETLLPTFQFLLGVPGSSSALSVARRFGIPGTLIERAEGFLSREDRNFDEVVKRLETERAALELARRAAEDAREEADSLKRQLSESLATIEERTKAKLAREANEIYEALRKSREELRQVRATLRAKKPDESQVRAAEKALDRVAAEVRFDAPLGRLLGGPAPAIKPLADGVLKKGQRVYVSRIRMTAEIVEILGPDQIRVAAGPMKLIVSPSELGEPEAPAEAKRTGKRPASDLLPRRDTAPEVAVQTTDNSCDLRGLRTDDALAMAVSFLDRALGSGQKVVFFIHGHGTGAVRDALRKELAMSRYVANHRPGGPHEGGDGVTAAWLAD